MGLKPGPWKSVGVSMDKLDAGEETAHESSEAGTDTAKVISIPGGHEDSSLSNVKNTNVRRSLNFAKVVTKNSAPSAPQVLSDAQYIGIQDKFGNSILHVGQFNGITPNVDTEIHNKWRNQSDFKFGFVPLAEQIMPEDMSINDSEAITPIEMHNVVRATEKHNFLEARLPVRSQLNVKAWKMNLTEYWDQQLLQLLEFGFPLDFNRNCPLRHEQGNHKSATDFPSDIDAYIEEELKYDAVIGPFQKHPIASGHCSPFMSRERPNSDRRRVIVDLSWPLGASVNAGIDKTSYLTSDFSLTFPTVDDITSELTRLGRGALLYKVDISRAFRYVKIDPGDYDLLGLQWHGFYVDTCVPFGTRHGSQIFQQLSDGVRYMMCERGFPIINYIDDYVGVGVPSVAWASYEALLQLMAQLGLTVSEKKLVAPSTCVTCLGVMIDTLAGTISIPPEKLDAINDAVHHWLDKDVASKRQLQSILGFLLYVHKCVKPARVFLNRMLELLRAAQGRQKILLTPDFKRDLRWFAKFLPRYNGVSLYDHKSVDLTLELDACLTGFGGRCGRYVYHLPIERGFRNWTTGDD